MTTKPHTDKNPRLNQNQNIEHELDSGDDGEAESDEIDATEIEHEDNTYYHDENDNKIYNEDCEHIADMIDGTFTFL